MQTVKFAWLLVLFLAACAGLSEATPTTEPLIVQHDLSAFTRFSYIQERAKYAAVPYCPRLGIFEAELVRRESGEILFKGSIAEKGNPRVDRCLEHTPARLECVRVTQLPDRVLIPSEEDAILSAFTKIYVSNEQPVECEMPCLYEHFTWDAFNVFDGKCNQPRLANGQGQAVRDLLEQLASQSQ